MTGPGAGVAPLLGDGALIVHSAHVTAADLEAAGLSGFGDTVALRDLRSRDEVVPAVALVVRDHLDLRRSLAAVQAAPTTRRVACVLTGSTRPPTPSADPRWPAVLSLTARSAPTCFTVLETANPVPAASVLRAMALSTVRGRLAGPAWPALGAVGDQPHRWPAADALSLVGSADWVADLSAHFPPDVIAVDEETDLAPLTTAEPHPVLGRLPRTVALGRDLTWEQYGAESAESGDATLRRSGTLSLGGLDHRLVNPTGFLRQPRLGDATLLADADPGRLRVRHVDGDFHIDARHGPSESDLPILKTLRSLHLGWEGTTGPHAYCRMVAGLAMAGVPLTSGPVPGWARALLAADLIDLLGSPADLGVEQEAGREDLVPREVLSIRQRRAALRAHSAPAWRQAVARSHGAQGSLPTSVSVLLPTMRPDQLAFALRQVARQRHDHLELVLVTHGFEADPAVLAGFRGRGRDLTLVAVDGAEPFGRALNIGAAHASGDVVLKMDDDDWYGPEFVDDLLLARDYSGAELVGCPPEFTYLEPLDLTVRRRDATEAYRPIVAGGTILVDRSALRAVGGFRETRRSVDAGLLRALEHADIPMYRTHGHGYVLRRRAEGHTWDPGLSYFISRKLSWFQWRGFSPSPLLDPDPLDFPDSSSAWGVEASSEANPIGW